MGDFREKKHLYHKITIIESYFSFCFCQNVPKEWHFHKKPGFFTIHPISPILEVRKTPENPENKKSGKIGKNRKIGKISIVFGFISRIE